MYQWQEISNMPTRCVVDTPQFRKSIFISDLYYLFNGTGFTVHSVHLDCQ